MDAIRLYKTGVLKNMPEIEIVAVWVIFDSDSLCKLVSKDTDLSQLKLVGLKNRLDEWKKEVRLLGYKPVVYLNKWIK